MRGTIDPEPADQPEDGVPMNDKEPRPWFRPKHVGYGYTPQTWQGYAVVFIPLVVLVVILGLALHH